MRNKKYLISIQQHSMFIGTKINKLNELNDPNDNTIQNKFNKQSFELIK